MRKYIKSQKFESIFSDYIRTAFEIRNDCDYEDFFEISAEEVDEQIKNATCFIETTEKYLAIEWDKLING